MKYIMAAMIGEIPVMVLPHLISNFVRFSPHEDTPAILNFYLLIQF